ncbi:hypothetical protein [Clostridium sp. VAP52]|uniref:hypothetical protein n=1 Tax=Clostridium sp. VAP52 TaxID=2949977 RepID=UPI00207A3306|nr:hypothetical protein [Clostridium sp. VAP52]
MKCDKCGNDKDFYIEVSVTGRTAVINNYIEGIIEKHQKDELQRDVIRIKVTKGNTPITDYFLKDVTVI